MDDQQKKKVLVQLGKRVSHHRKAAKLTFRELAKRCDVDYSDIKKIEKGEVNITTSTLVDLAIGIGIHPKELLNFDVEFLK
jgi:transcriptional regulator with XRE-family HTH domain